MSTSSSSPQASPQRQHTKGTLVRDIILFTLARLLLAALIAGVIVGGGMLVGVQVYLLVALLFAVLIAMPLSFVLFKPLRQRINEGIAAVDSQRRQQRADLEERLRGAQRGDTGGQ
ncbi:DUF4229 domain-containing protein [Hoyosella sp. G463]|uniref:DUF4229 domain-containing protein n=1 Tax=Lolliginicoccus lacisalsi TaxID=2742202 RepID=A0A927JDN7_9ACTN|nr:DUF4229 domain-containing protein [Lolliginicoccus lacisalsi]